MEGNNTRHGIILLDSLSPGLDSIHTVENNRTFCTPALDGCRKHPPAFRDGHQS